jgi:glutaredoxin 3
MQPNIEIYTWRSCPFCIRAKALLDRKGVGFTEYSIDGDESARSEMAKRSGNKRSVYRRCTYWRLRRYPRFRRSR